MDGGQIGGVAMTDESFDPREDARAFRTALGQFATGVTVVTCRTEDSRPLAIIANSFASVSLDPPLVLWSPARASRRFPSFAAARHYAIHVLSDEAADLCRRFGMDGYAFDDIPWSSSPEGVPLLAGALARFECEKTAGHDGGDHVIVVGRVLRVALGAGAPLVFAQGAYGAFVSDV